MESKPKVGIPDGEVNTQTLEKSNEDTYDNSTGDSDDRIPEFPCSLCNAKLKNAAGLAQHKKVVHGTTGASVHCEICGEKKTSRAAVEQHKLVAHRLPDGIRCDICGFNLNDMECYERHRQTVHRMNGGAPHLVGRIPEYGDRSRAAPVGVGVLRMTGWDTDPNDQLGPPPVRCDICGFKVRCTADLQLHKKMVHGPMANVAVCDVCDARLANPEGLEQHKKAVHSILTPLPCPMCGETQADRSTLRIHKEKVHRYKKEMRCEVCQEVFHDRPSFRKHQESAHAGENVRMHYLGIYDTHATANASQSVFEQNASVPHSDELMSADVRIPVNTELNCDICGNMFPNAAVLERHKKTDHCTDVRVFCDICGVTLPDRSAVAKHKQAIHSAPEAVDHAAKRGRYDDAAPAVPQHHNTSQPATATAAAAAPTSLPPDLAYLVSDEPSNTIVVGVVPAGCRDRDLTILFNRYGLVESVALICNERVALVKYSDISFPTRLVQMAKTNPFFVGTTHVYLGFSSAAARAATTPVGGEQHVPPVVGGEQHLPPVVGGQQHVPPVVGGQQHVPPVVGGQQHVPPAVDKTPPSKILHLDISAVQYPITVDVIKAICAPHGQVNRIVIGKKNLDHSLEALIEFNSVDEARIAKEQLHGADIYSGCCTLSVTYSRLQRVRVIKNDTESWDFTEGTVAPPVSVSGQRILLGQNGVVSTTSNLVVMQPPLAQTSVTIPQTMCMPPMQTMMPFCPPGYGVPMSMFPPGHVPQMRPIAVYPGMPTQQLGYPPTMPTQIVPTSSAVAAAYTTPPPPIYLAAPGAGQLQPVADSVSGLAASTRPSDNPVFDCMEGVVLMVNSVPANINCDKLFNLLCLYGNVARIKFLKSKAGCALIQLGSVEASDLIYRYYDGVTIFGQTIRFCHSKQTELQEQNSLDTMSDGTPVMKNYTSDPLNRFRSAATNNPILEPSKTLHFSNASPDVKPDEICRIFSDCGSKIPHRVLVFAGKGLQNTSLGLVEWDTLSEALEALILANHRPIYIPGTPTPMFFRLSYSSKSVSEGRQFVATGNAVF